MVYYVALPFTRIEGGLAPGEAVECPHGAAAIRRAQAPASDNIRRPITAISRRPAVSRNGLEIRSRASVGTYSPARR